MLWSVVTKVKPGIAVTAESTFVTVPGLDAGKVVQAPAAPSIYCPAVPPVFAKSRSPEVVTVPLKVSAAIPVVVVPTEVTVPEPEAEVSNVITLPA